MSGLFRVLAELMGTFQCKCIKLVFDEPLRSQSHVFVPLDDEFDEHSGCCRRATTSVASPHDLLSQIFMNAWAPLWRLAQVQSRLLMDHTVIPDQLDKFTGESMSLREMLETARTVIQARTSSGSLEAIATHSSTAVVADPFPEELSSSTSAPESDSDDQRKRKISHQQPLPRKIFRGRRPT